MFSTHHRLTNTMRYLVFAICAAFAAAIPSGNIDSTVHSNVVVISDVHGDDLGFLKSLWIGLRSVNASETISFADFRAEFDFFLATQTTQRPPLYAAADTALVQMGDLVDRGKYGKRCIDILAAIEPVIGWPVRNLYGNHDMFSMIDWGYEEMVHPEEDIERVNGSFPRNGAVWTELLSKSLLTVRVANPAREGSGSLFVHAGIDLEWLTQQNRHSTVVPIDALNRRLSSLISDPGIPVERLQDFFGDPQSPVMTRTIPTSFDEDACEDLSEVLRVFGVARMIVGHTPQSGRRVVSRCDGAFVLTDVALSRWMMNLRHDEGDLAGGQPSAVLLRHSADGDLEFITAFYTTDIASDHIFEYPIENEVWTRPVPVVSAAAHPLEGASRVGDENVLPPNTVPPVEKEDRKRRRGASDSVDEELVYRDRFGRISIGQVRDASGFFLDVQDIEQEYRIEYVEGEMVPHWCLPGIESVAVGPTRRCGPTDASTPRNRVFLDVGESVIPLLSYDRFGYLLAEQIVSTVNYFHAFNQCLGLVPRVNDAASAKADADAWVRSFFSVDEAGNNVKIINMLRVHPCVNADERVAEIQYVGNALAMYLEDHDEDEDDGEGLDSDDAPQDDHDSARGPSRPEDSDPESEDDNDEEQDDVFYEDASAIIRHLELGSFRYAVDNDSGIELLRSVAGIAPSWGLPEISFDNPRAVILNTTDRERMIDHDLSTELARQIIGITIRLHEHRICVGFTNPRITEPDGTDRVRMFFTTDGEGTSVTLLNLALASRCDDAVSRDAELHFVQESLLAFTDDDEQDDEDDEEEEDEQNEAPGGLHPFESSVGA